MSILEQIMLRKREEVAGRKFEATPTELRERPLFDAPRRSLCYSIELPGSTGIIAEFKRRSPSKGAFVHELATPGIAVTHYDEHGAAGISVLTDGPFFGGSLQDLADTHALAEAPLLRKDFIFDPYQLLEARAYGADVVLLIAAVLSPAQVQELAAEARSLGLEVLLELHHERELGHVCAEVDLVGVNNRNLKDFEVDLEHSVRLASGIPAGKIRVAESGIRSAADVHFLRSQGFDAFLIGEAFMAAPDPGATFAAFINDLKQETI
ncbi:indole-3-glycerol phosphate synthase TrpC [Flaviaesturariibacter flavus]|uniref:indole-3-glycerol-phosphate synthase n=1 Tax=Flaviaesturariibacter flavus TaxID=2502780 RepID=A0A4R1B9Z2_9BACT|nr:indole-3-glycerol phosphate synthase TrpC [Flaviaesturariibacter flavus]TCJ13755.1 indole-3-glycerol phosphate synthase TrpC [Flaviaesturariibacter flavus]